MRHSYLESWQAKMYKYNAKLSPLARMIAALMVFSINVGMTILSKSNSKYRKLFFGPYTHSFIGSVFSIEITPSSWVFIISWTIIYFTQLIWLITTIIKVKSINPHDHVGNYLSFLYFFMTLYTVLDSYGLMVINNFIIILMCALLYMTTIHMILMEIDQRSKFLRLYQTFSVNIMGFFKTWMFFAWVMSFHIVQKYFKGIREYNVVNIDFIIISLALLLTVTFSVLCRENGNIFYISPFLVYLMTFVGIYTNKWLPLSSAEKNIFIGLTASTSVFLVIKIMADICRVRNNYRVVSQYSDYELQSIEV